MQNKVFHLLLPLLLLLTACADDYINEEEEEHIVVEGWIKQGDHPVVLLTTSLAVSMESKPISSINDHVLNWARVTISDGEKEVVLMGSYDNKYLPPYTYTTTEMKGEVGKTYTIDITFKDMHATATTTIPEPVALTAVKQEKVAGTDSLYCLSAVFTDPPGKQYYTLFEKKGKGAQQFFKCDAGTFDDTAFTEEGGEITHPVYQPRLITEKKDNHSEYFKLGEMVCIELCTLDKQSYDLWYDFQNTTSLSGNFFMPYTNNIRSNINGGYGYWCGYGASNKWVKVGE